MKNHDTPAGGYFRMPNAWLRLPVSPGAKVLLAHFCASAGKNGESYYSYEQLGEIVGRSKSSVCAYVKELRRAGILTSKEQKTANGFNYRVLISIVGWTDLLLKWTSRKTSNQAETPSTKTECSIQSAERNNDPSGHHKNKIHKNSQLPNSQEKALDPTEEQTTVEWFSEDESTWRDFRSSDRNPPFQHGPLPPQSLVDKMATLVDQIAIRSGILDSSRSKAYIEDRVARFSKENKITSSQAQIDEAVSAISSNCKTRTQVDKFFEALQSQWKPFWKKLSTPDQIKDVILRSDLSITGKLRADLEKYNTFRGRQMAYEMILNLQQKRRIEA